MSPAEAEGVKARILSLADQLLAHHESTPMVGGTPPSSILIADDAVACTIRRRPAPDNIIPMTTS
jgi:hypothetical protein